MTWLFNADWRYSACRYEPRKSFPPSRLLEWGLNVPPIQLSAWMPDRQPNVVVEGWVYYGESGFRLRALFGHDGVVISRRRMPKKFMEVRDEDVEHVWLTFNLPVHWRKQKSTKWSAVYGGLS